MDTKGIQSHMFYIVSTEYAYGGHPYTFTGVFSMTPKRESDLVNQGIKFRESISMGYTSLTDEGVREIICAMEKQYIGVSYDMLHKYVVLGVRGGAG